MLTLTPHIHISEDELEFSAIRAQGAGGQNVNKVSTAIHLRFDIKTSSLPQFYKQRLLALKDQRVSKEGIIVIKAQLYRNQEKNKNDALQRLKVLILKAVAVQKKRRPTKPTKNSQKKRMDKKTQRGQQKILRKKIQD